jgi:hypothetical protein
VLAQDEEMPELSCYQLDLPAGSSFAAGAAVLMASLTKQTSLPWPDEFPRKLNGPTKPDEGRKAAEPARPLQILAQY